MLLSVPSLGPLIALLLIPLALIRSVPELSFAPPTVLSRRSLSPRTMHPFADEENKLEKANIGDVSFIHNTNGSVQIIRPRSMDSPDHTNSDQAIQDNEEAREASRSRARWHEREIPLPTLLCQAFDDPSCGWRDIVHHSLAWWLALIAVMVCGAILAFANYSALLTMWVCDGSSVASSVGSRLSPSEHTTPSRPSYGEWMGGGVRASRSL